MVVDDGSTLEESHLTFNQLKNPPEVTVLRNDSNMGKGAALKVGMRQLLKSMHAEDIMVTADADGQHLPEDIVAVAKHALKTQRSTLGCRGFEGDIPLRSRIGNILISASLRLFTGVRIKDTQTGLRALTQVDCKAMLNLPGNGYEYELHCLMYLIKRNKRHKLVQLPITTVYEPGNRTSHFNPVIDSLKIYFTFLRYVTVSLLAAVIDISIFTILTLFHVATLEALTTSRAISLPVYFMGMRNAVFKQRRKVILPLLGTAGLMVVNVIYLWQFIEFLHTSFNVYRWLAMIIGSGLFFICNFLIQHYVLYQPKPKRRRVRR